MTSGSESIYGRLFQTIIPILALNTKEQMITWQYILVAYCQLEALALELLRLHQSEDEKTFWGKTRLPSLNSAANTLRKHHIVPEEIIQILEKVAALRNSVAYKQLLYGITTYASYRGRPIFYSDFSNAQNSGVNEETVVQLTEEVHRAVTELNQRREEMASK